MRILITTPYDLAVPGGVNRHAVDLLRTLTERGHLAKLVAPSSDLARFSHDARVIPLGRVSVGELNGARSRVTLDPSLIGPLGGLMRSFRPEVIHLQEPFLPLLNTAALWHARGARIVGTFHTYSEFSRGYLWSWPWCRWINRRLHARIAVSEAAHRYATHYHPAPFHIIPNGVRLPAATQRRPNRPPNSPFKLLFVGRADEPRKGFAVLEEAYQRLSHSTAHGPAFNLTAVGPATPNGRLDDDLLHQAYADADVCIVPSLGGESFGLVALEALAHGVPVIASQIKGYAAWLGESAGGVLVPPGDAGALADAIRALAGDPLRHATYATNALRVANHYAWPSLVDRVLAVYRGTPSS